MNEVKKKKKIIWQQYIVMAFMILIGAFCGIIMVLYVDKLYADAPLYKEILSLLILFIGLYLALFFFAWLGVD